MRLYGRSTVPICSGPTYFPERWPDVLPFGGINHEKDRNRDGLTVVLLAGTRAAEPIRSGPPVGSELPCTFEPLNVTGPDAGEKTGIFCEYGASPVAMIFDRDLSEPLTRLIKRLDEATAREKEKGWLAPHLSERGCPSSPEAQATGRPGKNREHHSADLQGRGTEELPAGEGGRYHGDSLLRPGRQSQSCIPEG